MGAGVLWGVLGGGWRRRDAIQIVLGLSLLIALPVAIYMHMPLDNPCGRSVLRAWAARCEGVDRAAGRLRPQRLVSRSLGISVVCGEGGRALSPDDAAATAPRRPRGLESQLDGIRHKSFPEAEAARHPGGQHTGRPDHGQVPRQRLLFQPPGLPPMGVGGRRARPISLWQLE